MRFGFIAKHRSVWPVAWLWEALGVSRSGRRWPVTVQKPCARQSRNR